MKRKHKAIALFSGGLDSLLAVLHMQKLGYEVFPIFFSSPFYPPGKALYGAKKAGLKVKIVDVTEEIIAVVNNPKYGFGKHMNPCIDCHGMMFRRASEFMKEVGADFVISGEVLGQRPMSQRKEAMNSVAKLSGIRELLIRPLCQKLIQDTLPITEGWVDKSEMLAIQGRSRKPQLQMIKEFGIEDFESPGGGCLLTDKGTSAKIRDLIEHEQFHRENLKFLKTGRRVRLADNALLIVGRTKHDNDYITKNLEEELVIRASEFPGPLGVLLGSNFTTEQISQAGGIILAYNNKITTETGEIEYGPKFELNSKMIVPVLDKDDLLDLLINK